MRWTPDHPVRTDLRLAAWQDDADAACPGGRAIELLRYVPGRRATTLVEIPDGPAVLKVFHSPRARGNDRRLHALRPATGTLVPRPLAVGPAGHAGLLEYVPGRPLRDISGAAFIASCEEVGRALARLHASDVVLDRRWTAQSEIDNLTRRFPASGGSWVPPRPDTLVPAHRDLHPGQVVVVPGGIRLIDLDEATMAPAGLDVGNFLAHLSREDARGTCSAEDAEHAARAFLRGYGRSPRDLGWWRAVALARLAQLKAGGTAGRIGPCAPVL